MTTKPLDTTVDALVAGAGVGGIYATHRLSTLGLSVKCIDLAGDVGGTWYHNVYPGAMSDTETYLYRYSWDKESLRSYPWTHHYIYQPQILEYLNHVVQKFDLRKHMQFDTEMTSATWQEDHKRWRVSTSNGDFLATYLVNSLGILSTPNWPDIAGVKDFRGDLVHSAAWDPSLDLKKKRVGIIGNGSTGVQIMTALAPVVKELVSFQRHPQYSVPSGQAAIGHGYREDINNRYEKIWNDVWHSSTGFGVPEVTRKTFDFTPEERRQIFQECWDQGNGFRFMFSTFGDITTDGEANLEACAFIKSKIDDIVRDPSKARILKPTEIYARRPLCDSGYYQIFNRDNVDVIDLKATPIARIVPNGIELANGEVRELDAIVCATGFDALEGSYLRLKLTGRDGKTLQDHWKDALTAFGGIACNGFPNLFMIAGPQGPFANFPPVIEAETNIVVSCIEHAVRNSVTMEATVEAERQWTDLCDKLAEGSLFKRSSSWIFGANVNRKPSTKFFFGGLKGYIEWSTALERGGFKEFVRG